MTYVPPQAHCRVGVLIHSWWVFHWYPGPTIRHLHMDEIVLTSFQLPLVLFLFYLWWSGHDGLSIVQGSIIFQWQSACLKKYPGKNATVIQDLINQPCLDFQHMFCLARLAFFNYLNDTQMYRSLVCLITSLDSSQHFFPGYFNLIAIEVWSYAKLLLPEADRLATLASACV